MLLINAHLKDKHDHPTDEENDEESNSNGQEEVHALDVDDLLDEVETKDTVNTKDVQEH